MALKVHERVVDFLMSLSEGLMEAEKSNSIKGGVLEVEGLVKVKGTQDMNDSI